MAVRSFAKFAVAGASVACCALPVMAQSNVSIYGIVDLGITSSSNGVSGVSRVTGVNSGIANTSRLGFRGTEDLGGGLKALFILESSLFADTGSFKTLSSDYASATPSAPGGVASVTPFNRRALVGLQSSSLGTLNLGRDYSPFYYAAVRMDALSASHLGNVQDVVQLSSVGSERLGSMSNSVFYTTPNWGGFVASAAYGFGSESTGADGRAPKRANVSYGGSLTYSNKNLSLTAAMQDVKLPTVGGTPLQFTGDVQTAKHYLLGGRYTSGPWFVAAGRLEFRNPMNIDGNATLLGGGYTFGASTVLVQVQRMELDNLSGPSKRGTVLSLAYQYELSKRTALYAGYARVNNNESAQFAVVAADPAFPAGAKGADPNVFAVGIRHRF